MNASMIQFKIEKLQRDNMIVAIESIVRILTVIFTASLLPQLLYQYVYASQNLTAQPAIFNYIPLAAFVIGLGFFLYGTVTNLMRMMKIKKLEKELELLPADACCTDCKNCNCNSHGDCQCGCDDDMNMSDEADEVMMDDTSDSKNMMAAKMSSLNKRKKGTSKKK